MEKSALHCKMCTKTFCGPNRIVEALVHLKYNHQKIFEIQQEKNDRETMEDNKDLRSQVVTSSSSEAVASSSKSTQTDDKLSVSFTKPLIPGKLKDYITLFDLASDRPYKCLKCHKMLRNLKICVVHLYNVHSVSLKHDPDSTDNVPESSRSNSIVRRQTARKSVPTSKVQRDFKSRKRSKFLTSSRALTDNTSVMRMIRRKFNKEKERRRLATIKVALLRQQYASDALACSRSTSYTDLQFPSACSSPDSIYTSPVLSNRNLPRIVSIQSEASKNTANQSPTAIIFNQSHDVGNNRPSLIAEQLFHDDQPRATTSQSPAATTSSFIDAENQSRLTLSDSHLNVSSRDTINQSDPPDAPLCANICFEKSFARSSSCVPQLSSDQLCGTIPKDPRACTSQPQNGISPSQSASLWNSLTWNSTKVISPNTVPIKKRKHSLDAQRSPLAIQKPTTADFQSSSTAMLKQLKSNSLLRCRDVVVASAPKPRKLVSVTKSDPSSSGSNQEEHRQTARKSTRPSQVKHTPKNMSPLAVRDYLNSSENEKFLASNDHILKRSFSVGNPQKVLLKSTSCHQEQSQSPVSLSRDNCGHNFSNPNNFKSSPIVENSSPKFHSSVSEKPEVFPPGSSQIDVNRPIKKTTRRKSILTSGSR